MQCQECGNQATGCDQSKNVFCSVECHVVNVQRIPHYSVSNLIDHDAFREVVYTDVNLQVTTQALKPGEMIGESKVEFIPEIHPKATQIIHILIGEAKVTIFSEGTMAYEVLIRQDGTDMVIVPPNTYHLIENTGTAMAKFLMVYSPHVH